MSRVVVFCPNPYSLFTTTATELLRRQGVAIAAIVVVKLLNPTRFFSEFRRDGIRLLRKIWKKLILRGRAYKQETFETIMDLRRSENITLRSVHGFRKQHGIPIIRCRTLNDAHVVEALKKIQPDLVVFTGGGLIRQEVLQNAGAGVVNCHMGQLPRYRGMDVVEWPVLEGCLDQVGLTVHFMDTGVDTGDILRVQPIDVRPGESIQPLRMRFEPLMCRALVSTCLEFLAGKVQRRPQQVQDGRQYFIMHPRLQEVAARNLQRFQGT